MIDTCTNPDTRDIQFDVKIYNNVTIIVHILYPSTEMTFYFDCDKRTLK